MSALLRIEDLHMEGRRPSGEWMPIVQGVSLEAHRGEVLALIGESGAGKSTIALSSLAYARPGCRFTDGEVLFDGAPLLDLSLEEKRGMRGRRVAYIAQSAAAAFNIAHTLGAQITEGPLVHGTMPRAEADAQMVELAGRMRLPEPQRIARKYPHQVSGVQLQRLLAVMAMSCGPDLLVFDEPTTAIDVTTQVEVLAAFKDVIRQSGAAALYVTHDLAVVSQMADRIIVLYGGEIMEQGETEQILHEPQHDYTRQLMAAVRPPPRASGPGADLESSAQQPVLSLQGIDAGYGRVKGGRPGVQILFDVDIDIPRGQAVGVIGESGCGKSTMARVISGLTPAFEGEVRLDGKTLPPNVKHRDKKDLQRVLQMPGVSFNPKKLVVQALGRPLEFYLGMTGAERDRRVGELLNMVELPADYAGRLPHELSGGEKQRVNLARALAAEPDVILCDEVTSALDTVVGAAIIKLLESLQERLDTAFVFISHDLSTKEYEARRISRREFAGRLGAAGIAATAATSLLTASDSVLADTPVKGGRMRVGWYTHSANDTLNPNRLTTSLDFMRTYQICSPIVRYSTKLTAEPDLATEWNASDDLKTWRFKIRKGIEFHNGKSLTIQDCIYSLNRHRGEQSDSIIKAWLDAIADMKADGDWLVIDLKAPNADFPMYLGDMHAVIVPDGFEDFDNLVGTGPFALAAGDFRPGVGMLAKKNPNYHHEGYPHVDEVETFGIGDTAARVNALLAGDIHITVRVDPKSIPIIEGAPNTAMANSPSSRHLSFPMVSDRPPTDNRDFRQAMRLLLDRQAVLDNIQKGYGLIGNDTPISSLDPYFCSEIPQRDIDLDKAKFHLKKAGMDGGTINLHTSEAAGGVQSIDMALMMKENAAKIGFNINFVREPTDGYWSNIWLKRDYPIVGCNWMPRPTADLRFSLVYISGAKWNDAFWKHEKFDGLIELARGTKDGPERKEIYCEAQQIMWDEGGTIIPLFTHWLDARSTNLGGHRQHPVGEGDGFRIHEWGFLKS